MQTFAFRRSGVILLVGVAGVSLMLDAAHGATEPPAGAAPAGRTPVETTRHPELGHVRWGRDFDRALAASRASGKPVFVLFDEVPGCHTCVSFGQTVLTHPLIVEAIEDLFEPVAIFNNMGGADAAVLKSFGEPAWNNPVVRIVDAERRALSPRVDGDYTPRGIVGAMVKALADSKRPVPAYLALLHQEQAPSERAVFAMHCFWEGEVRLGAIEGVLSTRSGFVGGEEVVEVMFDPARVTREALEATAREMACRLPGRGGDEPMRPSTQDDKYQLRRTALAALPMTPLQATRANAAAGAGGDAQSVLSPRQKAMLARLSKLDPAKRPNLIGCTDLATAWREAESAAAAKR
ncbi:MAG: VPGUxxT family thioredoxin-like (seleno)protein, type 2 [Phycisphaerales bacterium]